MKSTEIIRTAMKKANITQLVMGERLGITQTSVNNRLSRQDMRLDTFIEMLNICGYTIEIKNPSGEVEYSFKPEVSSDEKDC